MKGEKGMKLIFNLLCPLPVTLCFVVPHFLCVKVPEANVAWLASSVTKVFPRNLPFLNTKN